MKIEKTLNRDELFEMYKKLSDRDKVMFNIKLNRYKKVEEHELNLKRKEIYDSFRGMTAANGEPFFTPEYLNKTILNR